MTRRDLEQIRHLNDMIYGRLMRIQELKSNAYPGAIKYDDSGASRPAPTNMLEHVFEMIDQEERRANRLINKRHALKVEALREIRAVCPDLAERHILYLRYLSKNHKGLNLEWSEVIKYVNKYHNIRQAKIYQLHHNAVKRLERHKI